MTDAIQTIVIVGGGTAGWMTAAALANRLPAGCTIRLVESEAIGIIGVGEATLPMLRRFNDKLGIAEDDFLRGTHATIKLGIEFVDWLRRGHRYFHGFGTYHGDAGGVSFIQYLARWMLAGGAGDLDSYKTEILAAYQRRFAHRVGGVPGGPKLSYAYHFDATLYAGFLRGHAERKGVERIEGRIVEVAQHAESGFIDAVLLEDGRRVAGDLFIDCSGLQGLLIEKTLNAGYDDWSRWLPVNSALALPSERVEEPALFTRATAHEAGWQWRIPLQHRTGNGYVFCDAYENPERASELLLSRIEGAPLAEPRLIRFVSGSRRRCWVKNCVAIGLASGFIEPLESTSIFLVQDAIRRLLANFPDRHCDPAFAERFDASGDWMTKGIRDFVIAHYKCTEREDTEFWRYCRHMEIPDSLAASLDQFREHCAVEGSPVEMETWFAVLNGQGLRAQGYDERVDAVSEGELHEIVGQLRSVVQLHANHLPAYATFLDRVSAT